MTKTTQAEKIEIAKKNYHRGWNDGLEAAAQCIECHVPLVTGDGDEMRPRTGGNRFALGYATKIRSIKEKP